MITGQYLHFPQGNGSYVVAQNIARELGGTQIWAVGEDSSGVFLDGSFPVFASHPQSHGPLLSSLNQDSFQDYINNLETGLERANYSDIAIAHHGFVLASILGKEQPVITYLHGTEMELLENTPSDLVKRTIREGISRSRRVIAISPIQKRMAERLFENELNHEVDLISNGVDIDRFRDYGPLNEETRNQYQIDPNSKLVLFAGRLTEQKGVETLISAFSDKDFGDDKQLVIVGSGSLEPRLKSLASNLGSPARFIPAVPQTELAKLMSAADVFAMPSVFEPFGLVCIEALASGTPVVASNVGILKDLVKHGEGGYVFERTKDEEENIEQLKGAIDNTLNLEDSTIRERTREVREDYSWEKLGSELNRIIQEINN